MGEVIGVFVDRGWWDLLLGEPGRVVLTELGVTGLLGGLPVQE